MNNNMHIRLLSTLSMASLTTVLILVFALAGCGNSSSQPVAGGNTLSLPACGAGPLFTVSPMSSADYIGLIPLGNLNPPGHTFPTDHIYFEIAAPGNQPPPVKSVRMPGDVWITEIRTLEHLSEQPPYTDYSLRFQPCAEYIAYFNHLITVTPQITAAINGNGQCEAYQTGGQSFRQCTYQTRLQVTAGTVIGTGGGQIGQWGIDLGAIDLRQVPLQWANQSRIMTSDAGLPYAACPVDAFEPLVRAELEARFGSYDGTVLRTVLPLCGTIAQDVAGTAQGIWVHEGAISIYPEDQNIALVHDNVDPTVGAFSLGPPVLGVGSTVFRFTPAHAGLDNREFSEVTNDGQVYCYGPISTGAMMVKLDTATRLLADFQDGATCNGGPYALTAGAAVFER